MRFAALNLRQQLIILLKNMAENQNTSVPEKSKRELFGERLKKKYPDREYADDEALFGQVNDDYDDYDAQIGQYQDREKRLSDMLAENPGSAQYIADMASGKDPFLGVIERLGIDGITDLLNNPDKQEEYAEANAKRIERLAKEKDLEETYQKNFSESMELLSSKQQERGLSDEVVDEAMALLQGIVDDAVVGKITSETMDMVFNVISRDADIENARSEGVVAGKNAKIDEKLRKPSSGDGTPNLAGSNNAPTRKPSQQSMFALADEAR